jgi:UDPglucose--hexose-1-phosphate uridylyltransferase
VPSLAAEGDDAERTPPTAVEPLTGSRANRDADLFWAAPATGVHELVDGGVERWRERMRGYGEAACLHLTTTVAARLTPQAELYALPFVPAAIARERERFGAYATRTMGGNLLADLLQEEVRRRERVVAIDAEAVLLAAFAGRVPYQLMLVPRTARMRFEDEGPSGQELLEEALARLARRLDGTEIELWVRTAPQGAEYYCWRIDIAPRLPALSTAFEHGTGVAVNPVAPELAAAELRELKP